jgi:uridine kinase
VITQTFAAHVSRLVLRDVRDRGRDIEGIIKQWFAYVKPNFEKVGTNVLKETNIVLSPR